MYLNQALQQLDTPHFIEAVIGDEQTVDNNDWQHTRLTEVPPDIHYQSPYGIAG